MAYSPQLTTDSRPVTCSICGSSAFLSWTASLLGTDREMRETQMYRTKGEYPTISPSGYGSSLQRHQQQLHQLHATEHEKQQDWYHQPDGNREHEASAAH